MSDPVPRLHDPHLAAIAATVDGWRRGRLADEQAIRAIRAYLDDREAVIDE